LEVLQQALPESTEKMTIKKATAASIAAIIALTITSCAGSPPSSSTSEGQTVRVGHVPLTIFAPLYVAEAKGYFKDAGISLQLEGVKSGQDAVPLASSGQLDVVVAGFSAGMFNALGSGLDVKVVGSMGVSAGEEEPPPGELLVRKTLKDSGEVTSVGDLKGKKIAAAGGVGSAGGYLTGLALKEANLTLNDVTIVNLGNPDIPAALASGSIDAGYSSVPFSTAALKDGTAVSLAAPPKGSSSTGIIYGGKFAKTDQAQKFFNALARGAKDLQNGKAQEPENLKAIADATGQSVEALKGTPLYSWLPNLAPLPDQLRSMEEIWMGVGAIPSKDPLPLDDYVDSSFSNNAKQ
jgi:NitT/TauT family transport system substrate-binding protein